MNKICHSQLTSSEQFPGHGLESHSSFDFLSCLSNCDDLSNFQSFRRINKNVGMYVQVNLKSLFTSHVAHQSRSLSRFLWYEATGMPVLRRVTPSISLAQEHNTMSPARTRTRTIRSGVEHTNHEATTPPTQVNLRFVI